AVFAAATPCRGEEDPRGGCPPAAKSGRVIKADVVALSQCIPVNRLGATIPNGMVYALKRDVVSANPANANLLPGQVTLRPGKRPRPIVLRANVGDVLEITFTNLLPPPPAEGQSSTFPVRTRSAGFHVAGLPLDDGGLPLVDAIKSDASWVGRNPSSLI